MENLQSVLYVVQEGAVHAPSLTRALELVEKTGANLGFLVLSPNYSPDMGEVKTAFEEAVQAQLRDMLDRYHIPSDAPVLFDAATPHAVTIIRHVLKHGYDLVIKPAEAQDGKGFRSLDMKLLRQCPCPIWLMREGAEEGTSKMLTAIDPDSEAKEGHTLSVNLIRMGQSLAHIMGAEHTIITCWDYEYEGVLRESSFVKMPDAEIEALLAKEKDRHERAVSALIEEAGAGEPLVVCLRGKAYDVIPDYAGENGIDLTVMGTVARTGIPGFIIGNTAENTLQKLSCSLFAAKPDGFKTPVKPL